MQSKFHVCQISQDQPMPSTHLFLSSLEGKDRHAWRGAGGVETREAGRGKRKGLFVSLLVFSSHMCTDSPCPSCVYTVLPTLSLQGLTQTCDNKRGTEKPKKITSGIPQACRTAGSRNALEWQERDATSGLLLSPFVPPTPSHPASSTAPPNVAARRNLACD